MSEPDKLHRDQLKFKDVGIEIWSRLLRSIEQMHENHQKKR